MKVGIIGATGKSGSRITSEAMHRGMKVIPLVRNARRLGTNGHNYIEKDLFHLTEEDLQGLDVVVDAFNVTLGEEELHKTSLNHLITLLAGNNKPRLIVVGGSGMLYTDKEKTIKLKDTSDFPKKYKAAADNMEEAFEQLKTNKDFNWTYISPSEMYFPEGERTGDYQIGTDGYLLRNKKGYSELSYADYALALVDEIENNQYPNQRITVCSK